MNNTKIFISSTCFDLGQIRADLRKSISEMGHEPILSELPSFTVLPELDTLSNCKRNVKENCDIFVLIVGCKRGSYDPTSGKSIVNIEYDTAVQNSKDVFVFVDENVYSLMEIWRKNKDADFSSRVDDSYVFEFLEAIIQSKKWIFTFKNADDICGILKIQISNFLKYLIDRKNSGNLDSIKEFENETEKIRKIVSDKPKYWELKLTIELLRTKLQTIEKKFSDLDEGLFFVKSVRLDAQEYFQNVRSKYSDLAQIMEIMAKIINELFPKSWGELGVAGNPIAIKDTVDKLYAASLAAFDWDHEICSLEPPNDFKYLNSLMKGCGKSLFDTIKELPNKIEKPLLLKNPEAEPHEIHLKFMVPPNIEKINREIKQLLICQLN